MDLKRILEELKQEEKLLLDAVAALQNVAITRPRLIPATRELVGKLGKLQKVISDLQSILQMPSGFVQRKRRGRKPQTMSTEECRKISQRMKTYWAERRLNPPAGPEIGGADLTKTSIPDGHSLP